MSDDRIRALEAALEASRERNEVLETDRRLLGARVAELEDLLLRTQRELDQHRAAPKPLAVRLTTPARRTLARLLRVASRRRRRAARAKTGRDGKSGSEPSELGPSLKVRERSPATPARTRRLKVLGVLDSMSATCFAEIVDLRLPGPSGAADIARDGDFDLVLIESAWQGNRGTWQYRVGSYAAPTRRGIPQLRALVDTARRRGIPTVFWNKEDPVHFTSFAEAARTCDYVFTTDADRIGAYQALQGRAQVVDLLQFGAQPSLHNPVGAGARSSAPVFAGTFHRRHTERQAVLQILLEAALPYGLIIYDRRHGSGQPGYEFPASVADRIVGSLPYKQLVQEYKKHRVFLNANSVTTSPTMCARRVFELLACGTAVVSTPSRGMEATFGDLVDAVDSEPAAKAALDRLLSDDRSWQSRSTEGVRLVMLNHTYTHRLGQVARVIGLDAPEPGPSVALACASSEEVMRLHPLLARMRGIPEIVVPSDVPGEDIRPLYAAGDRLQRVVRFDPTETSTSGTYASAAACTQSDWIVRASDVLELDPTVLTDLAVATMFSPARCVVARAEATHDQLYTTTKANTKDVVVRRSSDVADGADAVAALIASVG